MPRPSFLLCALLAVAGCVAHAREGGWASYRDAYRAMVVFEKYGKPKQFLQNFYQIMPKEKGGSVDGLRLTLAGKSVQLNLPLDALGRAVFPLLKTAYDENAALVLNQDIGKYALHPRVSIVTRPDGLYEAAHLRTACEQALAYLRYAEAASVQGKSCAGVRFSFAGKGVQPSVKARKADGGQRALPATVGAPFPDEGIQQFTIVNYRFADTPETGLVVVQDAPLAIAALIE